MKFLALITSLFLISFPVLAQTETTTVFFVCKTEQIVTDIAAVGMRNKEGLAKANQMLVEQFNMGDCAATGPINLPVKKVIELGQDFEGDYMALVQLDIPDSTVEFWSIIILQGKGA